MMTILDSVWPDTKQTVIVCKRLQGDVRSALGEKLKKVLKRHGFVWRNTSTHEGALTLVQFRVVCRELNDVIRSHRGPAVVHQLIAKIGVGSQWVDIYDPAEPEFEADAVEGKIALLKAA